MPRTQLENRPDPDLVPAKEASRILGCHPSTLRRWVKSGDAPAPFVLGSRGVAAKGGLRKDGKPRAPQAYRWSRQELLEFINSLPRSTEL